MVRTRAGVQGRLATAARIKSERSERLYAALHLPGEWPRARSRTLSASTWGWRITLPTTGQWFFRAQRAGWKRWALPLTRVCRAKRWSDSGRDNAIEASGRDAGDAAVSMRSRRALAWPVDRRARARKRGFWPCQKWPMTLMHEYPHTRRRTESMRANTQRVNSNGKWKRIEAQPGRDAPGERRCGVSRGPLAR